MSTTSDPTGPLDCFVIAPIGQPGSEIRRRSDQLIAHVIRPVTDGLGYEAVRGDQITDGGMITAQVMTRILSDDLVIADLTGQNPNVFYELAVRHAVGKPFVQMVTTDEALPFDVQGLRTIFVDLTDLDSVAEGKRQLTAAIKAIEGGAAPPVTPMRFALNLQALNTSGSPEGTGISQIITMLEEVLVEVRVRETARPHQAETELRELRRLVEDLVDRAVVERSDLEQLLVGRPPERFRRWVDGLMRRAVGDATDPLDQ